jgi:hypothetical protein
MAFACQESFSGVLIDPIQLDSVGARYPLVQISANEFQQTEGIGVYPVPPVQLTLRRIW